MPSRYMSDETISRDSSGGALDQFIQAFNHYELDAGLFVRCDDEVGVPWWDVVRYNVQFALCDEMGIHSYAKGKRNGLLSRIASFTRQIACFTRGVIGFLLLPRDTVEHIYVFNRHSKYLLAEIESIGSNSLFFGDLGSPCWSNLKLRKQSVELFVRIVAPYIPVSEKVKVEAERLQEEIRAGFGSQLDIRSIVIDKYKQYRASRLLWSAVLSRQQSVKYIGYIGDDSLKALISIANARNIKTREFQHAYLGKSHINYSYPALSGAVVTLPAEVMVYRDTGDINYPPMIVRPAKSVDASEAMALKAERNIDVLVGGSPTRADDVISITRTLVDMGLTLAVKLHPVQTEADSGLRKHFTKKQVQTYSKETDFCDLARRTKIYIPANPTSTTAFEAVESGASLVIVDHNGVKLTEMNDEIVSERVGSFETLPDVVVSLLNRAEA